jgi:site-specific DNA-methyltransferase (adenine-specific)
VSTPGEARAVIGDAGGLWPVDNDSAACVVTSPPYNAGIDYDTDQSNDQMPWDDYCDLATNVMAESARVLIDGGRCWINVTPSVPTEARPSGDHNGQASAERTSLVHIWTQAGLDAGLQFRDVIAWATPGRGPGCAWGSYETPSGPNLRGEWEAIIAFSFGPWARPTPAERKGWKDTEGNWPRLVSNVWTMQPEADRSHPAPFPLELPSRCIRLSSYPGELIVDPFVGSGTTLLAARNLGRNAIGFDRSAAYVERANARLDQLTMFGAA